MLMHKLNWTCQFVLSELCVSSLCVGAPCAYWPKDSLHMRADRDMPTLVTKDYRVEVALDEEITVVVPKMHVSPCVTPRKSGKVLKWTVIYWDTTQWKKRSKDSLLKYFAKFFRIHQEEIEYEHREVPLDSWFLGCWLGDGTSTACSITTADQEILDYITQVAARFDLHVVLQSKYHYLLTCRPDASLCSNNNGIDRCVVEAALEDLAEGKSEKETSEEYGMKVETLRKYKDLHDRGELDKYYYDRRLNPITEILKQLGIFGRGMKRIPELYLKNSREVRLGVLGGIIDTDGHFQLGGYEMCFANQALADDIALLARSLGFRCSNVKACIKTCTNAAGGSKPCQAYRFRICGGDELRDIPILLSRKRIQGPKVMRCDQLHFKVVP